MAIKIGKWEIAPQSGVAGENQAITHKLISNHTGREKYTKVARAYISADDTKYSDETLEVEAKPEYLEITGNTTVDVAYDTTSLIIPFTSNVYKFKIVPKVAGSVTLASYDEYTASDNVGTFDISKGSLQGYTSNMKVTFPRNTEGGVITWVFEIWMWVKTTFVKVTDFYIKQSSVHQYAGWSMVPDQFLIFDADPTAPGDTNTGVAAYGTQTVQITCNVAYTIEKDSLGNPTWLTLSTDKGSVGTTELTLTASKNPVGSAQRTITIRFIDTSTAQVLATREVTQKAGEPYAISWAKSTLTFACDSINSAQTNQLTANSDWQIEEKV